MSAAVRVAYLTSYYPAVSHTFIRREVNALRKLGVDVHTFSINAAHGVDVLGPRDLAEVETTQYLIGRSRRSIVRDLIRAVRAHPGPVARVAFRAARSRRTARDRLWQLFYVAEASILHERLVAADITHIHAHFANAPADVARWTAALGNRIGGAWTWSFTMHGPTEFYAVEEHSLPAKLASADLVACISDFCRSQLMVFSDPKHWPKFEVVHCGVIPEDFPVAATDGTEPFTVACVGRLVAEKGQPILVDALELLKERGVAVRAVFVGDGPARSALEADVVRRGLDATFTGPVGHDVVQTHLASADAFCLPSFAEGVPVVLMEAMASGLPVVTTRIAGIQELVEDGVSGFVISPGRADLLADAIAELVKNPEQAQIMGRAGRAKVMAEFDVRGAAAQLAEAFARMPQR